MGRKTYESIGHPLPNRLNIVITRQEHQKISGCTVVHSIDAAIRAAESLGAKEACVIGGGEIYREALQLADRIYLTRVHAEFTDADAFFPALGVEWEEVSREEHESDPNHLYGYTFLVFERRKGI
jgi:dihydrofolate reductase